MTHRRALFGALALSAFVLFAPLLAAEPRPGDSVGAWLSEGGWRSAGEPGAWTKGRPDGWTIGVMAQGGVVFRVDTWKIADWASGKAEWDAMLTRLGDTGRLHLTMLNGTAACAVQKRGAQWIAVILSISPKGDRYILMRSEILLEVSE